VFIVRLRRTIREFRTDGIKVIEDEISVAKESPIGVMFTAAGTSRVLTERRLKDGFTIVTEYTTIPPKEAT